MTVTPSARSKTSILRVEIGFRSASASAHVVPGMPQSSATAAASRALPTWCAPLSRELRPRSPW